MALSGKISGSYSDYYDCELRWSATQNIANNTSTIKVQWYFIKAKSDPYGSFNNNNTSKVTLNIAGSTYTKTANFDLRDEAVGTELLLATYSKTITHNSDGTKSASISGTHSTNIGLGTKTLSGTASLNTIPRASSVSASNMTMGTASTITVTKKNSGFTHRVYYSFGSKKNVEITSGAVSGNVSFTPPLSLASEIPNATSATITIRCVTYNGSTQVGSATKSVKLSVPSSVKPSVSSVSLAEAVSGLNAQFGGYIQGRSKISGTVNTTTAYGSAIASYRIEVNGAVYTSRTFTTDFLRNSGSQTIKVTVTDRRGRTSNAYTATYNVMAYVEPKITKFSVVRYKDADTQADDGEFIKVFISGALTSLSGKNTIKLECKHRLASGTEYTAIAVGSITNYSFTYESGLLSGFNSNSSYIFEANLTDYFTTAITAFTLPTAFATFDILADGTGFAFGKVAEEQDCLESAFNKTILGRRLFLAPKNNLEKQIRFNNTIAETDASAAIYKHNCYIYGGNSTSPISFGVFDPQAGLRALAYRQHLQRLTTEAKEFKWGDKDVDRIIESSNPSEFTSVRVWGDGYCVICGNVNITPDEAGVAKAVQVNFGKTFLKRPNVQVTANTSVPGSALLECSFTGLTTTGMSVVATRNSTASTGINWRVEGFIKV